MSKIRHDIVKLKYFARALGAAVEIRKTAAESVDKGYYVYSSIPKVVVFKSPKTRQIDLVLTLLHECGHLLHYARIGRPDPKLIPDELSENHDKLTRAQRGLVLEWERAGITLMPEIWRTLQLSIPYDILMAEVETDLWVYKYFYRHGKYPSEQARNTQLKRARKRHGVNG